MTVQDITTLLESTAPLSFQEEYDNAGLLTGSGAWECTGVLISLDTTEDIIDEAIRNECNLVVSHHPLIFRGMKRLTGKGFIERTLIKAIKNDIAIYAIHTNLDSVKTGVNGKIAEKLGLLDLRILRPKEALLKKMITFSPLDKVEEIRQALFQAGAGHLGKYSECSFNLEGTGTFKAEEGADPYVGDIGKRHEEKEMKIEVIFPAYKQTKITAALIEAHPYEEVAYDILSLGNFLSDVGSGLVGELPQALKESDFLEQISKTFGAKGLRHSKILGNPISRVALCGGAGSFLLSDALSLGADAFVTSDIKYHDFFEADGKLLLVDIGHYESEQFTTELLFDILTAKFPNFAILKTGIDTNPVQYFS